MIGLGYLLWLMQKPYISILLSFPKKVSIENDLSNLLHPSVLGDDGTLIDPGTRAQPNLFLND